jgi:serine/threonine protein kinase/Tfp pilus assembly protein PilF
MNDVSALEDEPLESLVAQAADEFLERLDRGERPEVDDYVRRYPRLAEVLPQVLPALKAMRRLSQTAAETPNPPVNGRPRDSHLLREIGRRVVLKALPCNDSLDPALLADGSLEVELGKVADDYLSRLDHGEKPELEEFLRRYPRLASFLPKILPALDEMRPVMPSSTGPQSKAPVLGCLGDYRLLREIGRGGMGVVYEAEQISLGRRVALKVLPFAGTLDAKQLQRFKNEAQAAAQLHHTNIVPVFAVGQERGVHYYAMQFIEGQTLAALIHELRKAAGLELPDTLPGSSGCSNGVRSATPAPAQAECAAGLEETPHVAPIVTEHSTKRASFYRTAAALGKQAAEALEHAHLLGVVHRDIKPANLILEERGNLWVTDFGLARFQRDAGLTLTGDLLGTLRYMSPEQALAQRGLVDHRSDIYSLGATLYELLTLHPVLEGSDRRELLRQIAWEEPRPPRRLNREIPVELETIVLKALAKEPGERYATGQELADDLQRFLDDRPVLAQRPTRAQQLKKWLRRHRVVVWIMAALSVMALIGSIAAAVLIYQEQQRTFEAFKREADQRRRAETNLRIALEALDEIYLKVVEDNLPRDPQREAEYRELLQKSLSFYEQFAQTNRAEPLVRLETGRAYLRIGTIHQKLGQHDKAEQSYQESARLLKELSDYFPSDPVARQELAKAHQHLGLLFRTIGRLRDAERENQAALDLRQQLVNAEPANPAFRNELASTHRNQGTVFKMLNRIDDAERAYQKAIDRYAQLADEEGGTMEYQQGLAASWNGMGILQADAGHFREAEDAYGKALKLYEKLAEVRADTPAYRQELAAAKNNFGVMLIHMSRFDEAEDAFNETLNLRGQLVEDFPSIPNYGEDLAVSHLNLGNVYKATGRRKEAEQSYRESLRILDKLSGRFPTVPKYREELASGYRGLGILLQDAKRPDEAVEAYAKAVDLYEKLVKDFPETGDYVKYLGGAMYRLALLEHNPDKLADARRILEKSIGVEQVAALESSGPHVEARNNLAWFLATCPDKRFRNPKQALTLARGVVEQAPQVGLAWNTLGVAYYRMGDWKASVAALQKSMELRKGGDGHDWFFLAMAQWQLGDKDQGVAMYNRAVSWMTKANRADDELLRFREEAEELLGLAKPESTPSEWLPGSGPEGGSKTRPTWAGEKNPCAGRIENG